MKRVCYLLAMVFMLASLLPCPCEASAHTPAQTAASGLPVSGHAHPDTKKHPCSPFCVCNQCPVALAVPIPFFDLLLAPVAFFPEAGRFFLLSPPVSRAASIWQPPQ